MINQTRDTSPEAIEAVAKAILEASKIDHEDGTTSLLQEGTATKYATAAITAYESATAPQLKEGWLVIPKMCPANLIAAAAGVPFETPHCLFDKCNKWEQSFGCGLLQIQTPEGE